ncbi:cobalamin biosynthesis protein CbiG [Methanomicrobiaceae archaeon CYW5]|uniref:cobalt-precorrin 5A hydrolase n=1 Tax=Methanovulcanius yangii TaxID=1789227 RepID=UPI0029CA37DC|nr:cobalt-precorrin 5A hydrolase [Methanovulcanius yangii]MBT8507634.1 cobalamin biosynthesis protein CbiG [Methanovulcanius yangii]
MKGTIIITLEPTAARAKELADEMGADVVLYSKEAFAGAYESYRTIIAVMSAGIAVRSAAPHLRDKWTDPCLVVVSPDFRYAIPLLGGHHGGNEAARRLEELGIHPVITTATETRGLPSVEGVAEERGLAVINKDSTRAVNAAILEGEVAVHLIEPPAIAIAPAGVAVLLKKGDYIVGVGCRRGTEKQEIIDAFTAAFAATGIAGEDVCAYATANVKKDEAGLIAAVGELGGTLIFVDDAFIRAETPPSPSRASDKLGLPGVAEPAALALSKRKEVIMKKQTYGGVTVAVIR